MESSNSSDCETGNNLFYSYTEGLIHKFQLKEGRMCNFLTRREYFPLNSSLGRALAFSFQINGSFNFQTPRRRRG